MRIRILLAAAITAIAALGFLASPEPVCAHSSCLVSSSTPTYWIQVLECDSETKACPAGFPYRLNDEHCFKLVLVQ